MATYFIIGGDGKEYGPITEADVRQWVGEGRLAAASLAKGEGDAEFRPLGKFPEFAELFAPAKINLASAPPAIQPLSPPPGEAAGGSATNAIPEDYTLDIIGCFSRGFELLKENFGTLFIGSLIFFAIQFGVGLLGSIPFVGLIIKLAGFICGGPLLAGLYYLSMRVNRGERAEVGEVFAGFRRGFGQLFLVRLIQSLVGLICYLPVIFLFGAALFSAFMKLKNLQPGTPPDPAVIQGFYALVLTALPLTLLCSLPVMFFSVTWYFALPLIIDKRMDCITALKTSWRMVMKHWFSVFGLLALCGILMFVGILLCCIGALFAFPVTIAASMIAYETIFCAAKK